MATTKKLTKKKKKEINKYVYDWQKENIKQISIKFNLDTDKDILAMLEKQENRTDYIRQLIKKDIEQKNI